MNPVVRALTTIYGLLLVVGFELFYRFALQQHRWFPVSESWQHFAIFTGVVVGILIVARVLASLHRLPE